MKSNISRSLRKLALPGALALCAWALPGVASAQAPPHYYGPAPTTYYGALHYGYGTTYYGGVHYSGGYYYGAPVYHSTVVVGAAPTLAVGIGPAIAPVAPVPVAYVAAAPVPVAYVPAPPAVGYEWIRGSFSQVGGSYVWVSGHWGPPVHAVAVW
jgi:hypothetical protein